MTAKIGQITPSAQFDRELDTPNWKKCALILSDIALRILIPFATCLALYATLPLAISQFVVPMAAIGLTAATGFLWIQTHPPVSETSVVPVEPPALPVIVPKPTIRGLSHDGNNCFLVSALQFMRKDSHFMANLREPYKKFYNDYANGSQVNPQDIRREIPFCRADAKEHDAVEAIQAMMEGTPFQARLKETHYTNDTFRPKDLGFNGFIAVSIDTFENSMKQFFMDENPGNQVNGQKITKVTRQISPDPLTLIIQFKRFESIAVQKGRLSFLRASKKPNQLLMKNKTEIDVPLKYKTMDLDAFIVHHGDTIESGHYIAFIKEGEQWYECNGISVTPFNPKDLPLKLAYVVHYSASSNRGSVN